MGRFFIQEQSHFDYKTAETPVNILILSSKNRQKLTRK